MRLPRQRHAMPQRTRRTVPSDQAREPYRHQWDSAHGQYKAVGSQGLAGRHRARGRRYPHGRRKIKSRDVILVTVMFVLLFGISLVCWLKPEDNFSESERRVLAKFPEFSVESVLNGKFMADFESYSLDQFPGRDRFRSVKAMASYAIFQKKDNNDIYLVNGHLSKMEYPMQTKMLDYAISHMEKIYNKLVWR